MNWPYRIVIFAQRMTLRLFSDWKVIGRENVPPMGPLIIVANHQSNFDPPLLSSSLPRRMELSKERSHHKAPSLWWAAT